MTIPAVGSRVPLTVVRPGDAPRWDAAVAAAGNPARWRGWCDDRGLNVVAALRTGMTFQGATAGAVARLPGPPRTPGSPAPAGSRLLTDDGADGGAPPSGQSDVNEWRLASALEAAAGWLTTEGAAWALGPIGLTTWHTYRVRLQGPSLGLPAEPDADPELVAAFRHAGWGRVADYVTKRVTDHAAAMALWRPALERAERRGWRCATEVPAVSEIHTLVHAAFQCQPAFTPVELATFAAYMQAAAAAESELRTLRTPEGRLAGMAHVMHGETAGVIKTLAVHPDYHRTSIGPAMACDAYRAIGRRGVRPVLHACMLAGNAADRMDRGLGESLAHYALFGLDLKASGHPGESE